MRSRTPIPQQPVAPIVAAPAISKRRALRHLAAMLRSVIDWFRAGYADDAPRIGYSPLIALHGPVALTPRQIERVVDELQDGPADTTDIEVAITKTTDRLPTDNQLRTVARALQSSTIPATTNPSHPPSNR